MTKQETLDKLARLTQVVEALPSEAEVISIQISERNKYANVHLSRFSDFPESYPVSIDDSAGYQEFLKEYVVIDGIEVFRLIPRKGLCL